MNNESKCELCTPGIHILQNFEDNPMKFNSALVIRVKEESEPRAQLTLIQNSDTVLFSTYISHCPGCGKLLTGLDLDLFWGRWTVDEYYNKLKRENRLEFKS